MKNKVIAFDKELQVSRKRTLHKFLKLADMLLVIDNKKARCGFWCWI